MDLKSKLDAAFFGSEKVDIAIESAEPEDVLCCLDTYFEGQEQLQQHLIEGFSFTANKLLASALLIDPGQYMVWSTDSDSTMLIPINMPKEDRELNATPAKPLEISTARLLQHWDKVNPYLFEANTSSFQSNHPGRIHPIDTKVANHIDSSGKSHVEIADEIGVHPSTVSRWMTKGDKAGRNPTLAHAGQLAASVGAAPDSLFAELDSTHTTKVKHKRAKTGGSGGGRNKNLHKTADKDSE